MGEQASIPIPQPLLVVCKKRGFAGIFGMSRCMHGGDAGKQRGVVVGASTATRHASSALRVCPPIRDKKSKMQY